MLRRFKHGIRKAFKSIIVKFLFHIVQNGDICRARSKNPPAHRSILTIRALKHHDNS
jgi:hypothetical protein